MEINSILISKIIQTIPDEQKVLVDEFSDQKRNETSIQLIGVRGLHNNGHFIRSKFFILEISSLNESSTFLFENIDVANFQFQHFKKIYSQDIESIEEAIRKAV